MNHDQIDFLRWVYDNAYPNITYFAIFILALLVQFTFSGHVTRKSDLGVWDHIVIHMKSKLLVAYLLLLFLFNVYLVIAASQEFGRSGAVDYIKMIYSNMLDNMLTVSAIVSIVTVFILPYFFHLIHRRYISPKISSWKRQYRVSQTSDTLSDIRVETDKFKSKTFDNRKYYKDEFIFMGLDRDENPIYLPDEEFKSKNLKILGATQTGKGVIQQVLIDQAIKKGWGTWFVDQKPDDFIYSVIVQSCKDWGRSPPVILDLTGESIGSYAPFEHGVLRERLQRFNKLFGLVGKGTDADHYKAINRQIMTFLSDYWDGTLQHLDRLLNGKDNAVPEAKRDWVFENSINIRTKLDEWKLLPHLFPNKGEGFNVQDELINGSVVYVRGRQDDDLIREVVTSLLVEWKDCVIKKLHDVHIFTVLDEVKFCISPTVASSLATVLSKDANMSLAYQERDDVKFTPDQTVDRDALKNQVETNTLITLSYKCSSETAEWISENTGSIQKSITRLEGVDTDGFGAENWDGKRMIGSEKENYISVNSILSLNKRVGIFMNNEGLAQYLFTSWIPVSKKIDLPQRTDGLDLSKKVDLKNDKNGKNKVIVNNEHKSGEETVVADKLAEKTNMSEQFRPEDDPDFIRMLDEQMRHDAEPHEHYEEPNTVVSNADDLISNIGKKGKK